jgi:hypothetical protein
MNDRAPPPWPEAVRAQARRCRRTIVTLRRNLIALCPDAPALALNPPLAERINTTPYDHTAADALDGAERLLSRICSTPDPPLSQPITRGDATCYARR